MKEREREKIAGGGRRDRHGTGGTRDSKQLHHSAQEVPLTSAANQPVYKGRRALAIIIS